MNDHNPTDPNQQPLDVNDSKPATETGSEQAFADQNIPVSDNTEPQIDHEADTRPSIGTLQSMQDENQHDTSTKDEGASADLAGLRSKSQSFIGAVPNVSQPVPPPVNFSASGDSSTNNEAEMAQAATVQARYGDRLLQLPHVVGVGIGFMKIGDQVTSQIALVVMVDQKIEEENLQPEQRIPSQLDGVPIMIQEVGTFTAF
jgi:hypothetical protein